ncbi:MAG: 30S ribosomal protein S9 [Planctomycetota bacterium]|jgi:small subunit ribosomal protein S9|nr:30S ribosomal protein S9 [Planctomycetia bacterium]RLS66663.1 MAG: 30S ribosomal protein S9 [Planctomycetota bacterium]
MAVEQNVKSVRSNGDILATGRRKTSVARVRLRTGSGIIKVNGREFQAYFPSIKDQVLVSGVLEKLGKQSAVNIVIKVSGGGITGQAGACRLGIARALKSFAEDLAEPLRQGGFLTRDSRMKERKKYGLRGARRGTQFSKR